MRQDKRTSKITIELTVDDEGKPAVGVSCEMQGFAADIMEQLPSIFAAIGGSVVDNTLETLGDGGGKLGNAIRENKTSFTQSFIEGAGTQAATILGESTSSLVRMNDEKGDLH